MIGLSASALPRAEKCPASASLPRVRALHADAEAGTEGHANLEAEHPEGAEMAYAYNPVTGKARFLGQGLRRAYDVDWQTEIPGTADRVEVEADRVVVTDHKTGFGYMVAPARVNLQLAHNALCAADVNGKRAALVRINRTNSPGRIDEAEFDAFDLAAARDRIRAIWQACNEPQPRVVTGEHCWRCECVINCPAHLTMAVAFSEGMWPGVMPTEALTLERVAKGWEQLKTAKRLLGVVEKSYRAFASLGPIPLGNGRVLAERPVEREELDGRVVRQVLRDLYGDEVAEQAVELTATKTALEAAIGSVAPKGQKAAQMRRALAAIADANGVVTKRTMKVDEYDAAPPQEK